MDDSKPLIVLYEEFKENVADITNQYIDSLPAIFIAEFYDKLASQFRGLAQQQLQIAKKGKEVKEHGNGTC